MKIIRGFKRRQYEAYRVAAWHIYYMASLFIKDPKAYHMDKTMPPYDEMELSESERAKLAKYRAMKERDKVMDKDRKLRKKLIKDGVIEK